MFCKHEYIETGNCLVDVGRNKLFFLRCEKCGKETIHTLLGRKKKWNRGKFLTDNTQ